MYTRRMRKSWMSELAFELPDGSSVPVGRVTVLPRDPAQLKVAGLSISPGSLAPGGQVTAKVALNGTVA